MLCTSLLLFNFQGSFRHRLFAATLLLYHNLFRLSIPFLKVFSTFFKVFSNLLRSLYSAPRSRGQPAYYITSIYTCQGVFDIIFIFWIDVQFECDIPRDNIDIFNKTTSLYSTRHTKSAKKTGESRKSFEILPLIN